MASDPTLYIPAATVVLFRPGPADRPELLMLERGGNMAFAAGMLVFPGGRVDPGDRELAGDDPDTAARIAAIRETIEEAGIAIGLTPAPDPSQIARLRAGLAVGEAFALLLEAEGLALNTTELAPFARWRPQMHQTRNFDTRFYLADAPPDADVSVDGSECVAARWATAAEFLRDERIIFPTRRNLERLAAYPDRTAAIADAARLPMDAVTPWIETHDGERWLTIPEGIGYPVTRERIDAAMRG